MGAVSQHYTRFLSWFSSSLVFVMFLLVAVFTFGAPTVPTDVQLPGTQQGEVPANGEICMAFEAKALNGQIGHSRAMYETNSGNYIEALEYCARAEAEFAIAIETGESDS